MALQDMGHKRLAIEAGEDPVNNPIEYILDSIKTIYSIKHKNGSIRRVNVNIAATTVENYKNYMMQALVRIFCSKKLITKRVTKLFTRQDRNIITNIIQKLWIELWKLELMM